MKFSYLLFYTHLEGIHLLSIGQNIQMEPIEELHDDKEALTYNTEVTAYDEDAGVFRMKKPVLEASDAERYFQVGGNFYLIVVEEDGEVYQLESTVLDMSDSELTFKLPEKIKRIQRRAFVRAEIAVLVKIEDKWEVETEDLSGGGMHLIVPASYPFNVDDQLHAVIELPGHGAIKTVSKIVRLETVEDVQHVYVSFTEIEEADRRKIVYYCFQKHIDEYRNQR